MIRMVEAWAIEETAEGWLLEDREGNQWIVKDLATAVEQEEWMLLWIADMHTTDSINDNVVIKVWIRTLICLLQGLAFQRAKALKWQNKKK